MRWWLLIVPVRVVVMTPLVVLGYLGEQADRLLWWLDKRLQ